MVVLVRGPFARFQPYSAGTYRATMKFMPHSAAYGLILHLAGIESRLEDSKLLRDPGSAGPPSGRIAVGAVEHFPTVQVNCQQMHNYPVGPTGKKQRLIAPARNITSSSRSGSSSPTFVWRSRWTLTKICWTGCEPVSSAVLTGSATSEVSFSLVTGTSRPAMSCLPRRPRRHTGSGQSSDRERIGDVRHSTYLTIRIDRTDSSKTVSKLFCPVSEATSVIPVEAWQDCVQAPTSVA